LSNDFTLAQGGKRLELYHSDIHDWNITFADTGVNSNIGMRLKAVEKYLYGEEMFLANYADGLTDLHLPDMIENFQDQRKTASFISVRPSLSYHVVSADQEGLVSEIREISRSNLRINGGYFAFRNEIFEHIRQGEELVHQPFQRLIEQKKLSAYPYDGYFASMDTFKDKQALDDLYSSGKAPWELWKENGDKREVEITSPILPTPQEKA
jgi:glucose-1-phosphate cytidylyltransferase